jgi:hypothetical protein
MQKTEIDRKPSNPIFSRLIGKPDKISKVSKNAQIDLRIRRSPVRVGLAAPISFKRLKCHAPHNEIWMVYFFPIFSDHW